MTKFILGAVFGTLFGAGLAINSLVPSEEADTYLVRKITLNDYIRIGIDCAGQGIPIEVYNTCVLESVENELKYGKEIPNELR